MAYCQGCNEDNAVLELKVEGRWLDGKHLHTKLDRITLCDYCYERYMNSIADTIDSEDGSYES